MQESKQCAVCATTLHPTPGRSKAQWERQQCCTARCANAQRARRQIKLDSTVRAEAERWARWWERRRYRQDRDELRRWKARRWPQCDVEARPAARLLIAGYCIGCSVPWVDYTLRQPSGYCNRCQDKRWRTDSRHKRRAWKTQATVVEVISPEVVFARDGYRCRLCGKKTNGIWPSSSAPTIDHIVPLSQGGEHSYLNVQCACFSCNSRKGGRAANDQLRLIA